MATHEICNKMREVKTIAEKETTEENKKENENEVKRKENGGEIKNEIKIISDRYGSIIKKGCGSSNEDKQKGYHFNFKYNNIEYICDYNPDNKTKGPITISKKGDRENGTDKRVLIDEKEIRITEKNLLKALDNDLSVELKNKLLPKSKKVKSLESFFKIYDKNCKSVNVCIF